MCAGTRHWCRGPSHRERMSAKDYAVLQRSLRQECIDPVTGGCPPFLLDGHDLATTPLQELPDAVLGSLTQAAFDAACRNQFDTGRWPKTQREALQRARIRAVEAVEQHEAGGGRVRVETTRGESGCSVTVTTWLGPDGQPGRSVPLTRFQRGVLTHDDGEWRWDGEGMPVQFSFEERWDGVLITSSRVTATV